MAAEIKRPPVKKPPIKSSKPIDNRPKMQFAFGRKNYMILLGGLFLITIGFILLSGGGTKDPNQFSYELFSTQRMVTAPIILLLGYITVAVAIMYKEKTPGQQPPVA